MPNGKPNILVIWGDDIGISNLSCFTDGMMGYRTPNIDRIATEGMRVHRFLRGAKLHCGPGSVHRWAERVPQRAVQGWSGWGDLGWAAEDPTIAELLKPLGYATASSARTTSAIANEHLPTMHGFDEFFGNLYHLNAEEEPEQFDYPHKDMFPRLHDFALPRGVLKCKATTEDRPNRTMQVRDRRQTDHRRHRAADRQADGDRRDDIADATLDFVKRQHAAGTPFFIWCNFTRMHAHSRTSSLRVAASPGSGSPSTTTR